MSQKDPKNTKAQDSQEESNGSVLPKVAAVGAVVAAGAAAAHVLRDEETREKVVQAAKDIGTKALEAANQVREKGEEVVKQMQEGGNNLIADLTTRFDELRTQIEESEAGKKFEKQLAELGDKLNEAREVGEEEANAVAEDIQTRMEKLQADFDKNAEEGQEAPKGEKGQGNGKKAA